MRVFRVDESVVRGVGYAYIAANDKKEVVDILSGADSKSEYMTRRMRERNPMSCGDDGKTRDVSREEKYIRDWSEFAERKVNELSEQEYVEIEGAIEEADETYAGSLALIREETEDDWSRGYVIEGLIDKYMRNHSQGVMRELF